VDSEKALAWIDGSKGGDETATYDKGGWAAWMLYRLMGREANLAGLRDFIGRYHGNPDHPVIQDFTRVMREHAPDPAAYDEFVQQWYYEVVLPSYRVHDAKKAGSAAAWTVTATIENAGTGRMPVEIAAVAGERWPDGKRKAKAADGTKEAAKPWQEARVTVVLGAGEKAEVTIPTAFEPERVVVDPDACVLMLKRDKAEAKL
jgi:aminopeptidase N